MGERKGMQSSEKSQILAKGRSFRGELFSIFYILLHVLLNMTEVIPLALFICLLGCWLGAWKIKVYEKEVIVTKYWFWKVVLPTDSVNSTTSTIFWGCGLATSSEKTGASWVTNCSKIRKTINKG